MFPRDRTRGSSLMSRSRPVHCRISIPTALPMPEPWESPGLSPRQNPRKKQGLHLPPRMTASLLDGCSSRRRQAMPPAAMVYTSVWSRRFGRSTLGKVIRLISLVSTSYVPVLERTMDQEAFESSASRHPGSRTFSSFGKARPGSSVCSSRHTRTKYPTVCVCSCGQSWTSRSWQNKVYGRR